MQNTPHYQRIVILSAAILAVLFVLGCGTVHYKMYAGPELPKERCAIIDPGTGINILSVDRRPPPESKNLMPWDILYDLAPGERIVRISYWDNHNSAIKKGDPIDFKVTVEEGHMYEINAELDYKNQKWKPIIKQLR